MFNDGIEYLRFVDGVPGRKGPRYSAEERGLRGNPQFNARFRGIIFAYVNVKSAEHDALEKLTNYIRGRLVLL